MAPAFTRPKPTALAIATDGPGLSSRHSSVVRAAFDQRGIHSGLVEAVCDGKVSSYLATPEGQAELSCLSKPENLGPRVQAFGSIPNVVLVVGALLASHQCARDLDAILTHEAGREMVTTARGLTEVRALRNQVLDYFGNPANLFRMILLVPVVLEGVAEVIGVLRKHGIIGCHAAAPVSQTQPVS